MLAIFLIATLGFTIYSHHCNSSGETYSSLFEKSLEEEDPCQHESKVESTCCSMANKCWTERVENGCCSNFEVFVRADLILNLPSDNSEFEINDITLFESDFELPTTKENELQLTVINKPEIPPPLSGAELIIMLHHQKISPDHIV